MTDGQTLQTPADPDRLTTRPPRPSIDVNLQRVTPDQVAVVDLSRPDDSSETLHDLVTLDLGGPGAKASLMGTLDEIVAILAVAMRGAAKVELDREARS